MSEKRRISNTGVKISKGFKTKLIVTSIIKTILYIVLFIALLIAGLTMLKKEAYVEDDNVKVVYHTSFKEIRPGDEILLKDKETGITFIDNALYSFGIKKAKVVKVVHLPLSIIPGEKTILKQDEFMVEHKTGEREKMSEKRFLGAKVKDE